MNLNKQTITYSFIIIFIIITFIHLYKINNKNNNNDKENFADLMEDQNLQGFSVSINSMSQVLFGNTPQNKRSLLSFMDEKVSKTELNDSISDKATKTELNDLISDKATKTELNDIMPSNSIIQYGGEEIPQGWQLCDGAPLLYNDGTPVPSDPTLVFPTPKYTPNLSQEYILDPTLANRFHNGSYAKNAISSTGYVHQSSMLANNYVSRWTSYQHLNHFMRMRLDNTYIVTGVVVSWYVYEPHFSMKELEVTGYNYKNNVDIYNDSFLRYNNIEHVPNNTDKTLFIGSNNSTTLNAFSSTNEAISLQLKYIKFKNPTPCNYITVKPIKSANNNSRVDSRLGLIVKPINQYIIKQPKK